MSKKKCDPCVYQVACKIAKDGDTLMLPYRKCVSCIGGSRISTPDRFALLNPEERDALRVLIQNHLNTISEISLHKDFRVIGYMDWLAKIEQELINV